MAYGDPIPEEYKHQLVMSTGFNLKCRLCNTEGTAAEFVGRRCVQDIEKDRVEAIAADHSK